MVLAENSVATCASWREIASHKFRSRVSDEQQLRHNKFGNGKTTALGHRHRIARARMCKPLRSQSYQSAKYFAANSIRTRAGNLP